MCRAGADDALANATRAVELEREGSPWRDLALWLLAIARLTVGDRDGADATFAEAATVARSGGNVALHDTALAHRALLAVQRGDWHAVTAWAGECHWPVVAAAHEGHLAGSPALAVGIWLTIHDGDVARARRDLIRAAGSRYLWSAAAPALSVQCLLTFARAHLAVGDPAGAGALVVQADEVIRVRPDLGVLPGEVDALRAAVAHVVSLAPQRGGGATSLTVAELRVLALLPYYLSFKEIGQRLGVKETTVKSHALSIYTKLGAASRGEAVDLAVGVGLLEGFPAAAAPRPLGQAAARPAT